MGSAGGVLGFLVAMSAARNVLSVRVSSAQMVVLLPLVLAAALLVPVSSAAQTQTAADLEELSRLLVARYVARTILQGADLDMSRSAALTAEWPTDLKLALALNTSNEKELGAQLEAVRTHLPALTERLKNELYVESWLRNRSAEMKDASLQKTSEMLETRQNETAVGRAREAIRARTRLSATLGDALTGLEQTFRMAVRGVLTKTPALATALATSKPESAALLDSRNRLMTALTEAEKR